jgi:exopolyphosphatase/guanosine-5'-triphosphate,3'-diphosphate pyrophosphatase
VGSIAWSTRYFVDGQFTKKSFVIAEIAAKAVLDEALDAYHPSLWDTAYGSAGTVSAIADVLVACGWPAGSVTQEGLDWLMDKLIVAQSADRLKLPGMREDRKAIIGGGVSIVRALFSLLGIKTLNQAAGGLRHGLICDLLGASTHDDDLQAKTVQRLASKFDVDATHGARVGKVATQLFTQLTSSPGAVASAHSSRHLQKLKWAAQLHEIGSHISHSDYHKHGAYILDNADAIGFSLSEMHRLSILVLGHRGKLRKIEAALEVPDLAVQLIALRLAVILSHARRDPDLTGMTLTQTDASGRSMQLRCRNGWAEAFPQSAYLLREEAQAWQRTPWSLEVVGC